MEFPDSDVQAHIDRYLYTGQVDPYFGLGGGDYAGMSRRNKILREALVAETKRRAGGRVTQALPSQDILELTRRKIKPMIDGLFPKAERQRVLAALERSIVFVTSDSIEQLLIEVSWNQTAWTIANIFLQSLGSQALGDDWRGIVGLSEETSCFVAVDYFVENDSFADFLVHEVAHIFHNCKRERIGLESTRHREWLLEIDFSKRETFAYSCEAYSRILERAENGKARQGLASDFFTCNQFPKDAVDLAEVAAILSAATAARNGWKVILSLCAPPARLVRAKPASKEAPSHSRSHLSVKSLPPYRQRKAGGADWTGMSFLLP